MAEAAGLHFAPLPGDPRVVLESAAAARLLRPGHGPVAFARRFLAVLEPWFEQLADATAPLTLRSDLAVYSPLAFTVWHQAQSSGIPTVLATLQPFEPTRSFAAVATGHVDLGRLNLASHRLLRQLFWQPLRTTVNRWRSTELDLPPLPLSGPFGQLDEPVVCGYSTVLLPRPADWPDRVTVTGAWHQRSPGALDEDLLAFLDHPEAPIYVGFGSLAVTDVERLTTVVGAASLDAGRRVVLGSGWAGLDSTNPDRVHVVGDTPHDLLFPRMSAVVHHGGAGTTHTAARCGTPQVIAPTYADQPFWSTVVRRAGIGTEIAAPIELEASELVAALHTVTRRTTADRARRVATLMQQESGVAGAVAVIERHLDRETVGAERLRRREHEAG